MCGILAYYGNVSHTIKEFYDNLEKIKNRGQDSLGITFINNKKLVSFKEDHFSLQSKNIIGHVRYTTSSKSNPIDQPFISENTFGIYSLIFNGNIPLNEYREYSNFTSDTLAIINFLNKESINCSSWEELLETFIKTFDRAFSLIIQTKDTLFVLRDKYGVRPLSFVQENNYIYLSSESFIFDKKLKVHEIQSGNLLKISSSGMSYNNIVNHKKKHCLFEYIYFLNKNSMFGNIQVEDYRKNVAITMAKKESFNKEMIVVGVPNTGLHYSEPYARQLNIPHKQYITKNKNISRTFIVKGEEARIKYAKQKYIFNESLKDKNVVLIDDSIVRGLTMKILVEKLYEFGVNEIHIRIMCPPIVNVCNYGIDIPTKTELIYNNTKDIRSYLNCDSIIFFDINDYKNIFKDESKNCMNCLKKSNILDW